PALGARLIWVILLNGGTLAINSVFDKDEGDIGYLNAPPPLPRHLLAFSGALLAGGQVLAFALPPAFRVAYAICFVLSILYSVPPSRFQAVSGWAPAVLAVRGWRPVVHLVAWVAVLVPWYRRREALPAPAHQRGMYRALAAWAVTDLVVLLVFAR